MNGYSVVDVSPSGQGVFAEYAKQEWLGYPVDISNENKKTGKNVATGLDREILADTA